VRQYAVPLFVVASAVFGVAESGENALAQTVPAPAASASPIPVPAPTKKPARFAVKIETYTSGTNQQFVGPGIRPAEGPAFTAGGALAPGTPYDFFSGGSQATGQGISEDFLLEPVFYANPSVDVSATIGYGSASGTGNVVNYWGDAIVPSIDPNLGRRAYTLTPQFTTHNGQDPISATRLGVLQGSIMDHNGNGGITLGYFNLHQTVPFAMSQAPWVSTPFQVVPQLPNTIGDGPPAIDVLAGQPRVLPLSGFDAWYKAGLATFEVAGGLMPAPADSPARATTASVVLDRGSGLRYSGELTMLDQDGPETGRVLFGTGATLTNGVPQSTLFGQHQFVAGLGATFVSGQVDADLRYGYSCYGAIGTAATTASCTSGNYLYGKLHHGFTHFDLALEGVRNEASYAPAILDYGTAENVWTYPAAWPGRWLRGTYQAVDNSMVGPNRQGFRIGGTTIVAGIEVRLSYARYTQIQALDGTSAFAAGFIEPYFLPQLGGGSTGIEQHAEGWFTYHAKWADVALDLAQVNMWRSGTAVAQGADAVRMAYPMGTLAFTRRFGPKVTATAGVGRMALNGRFDTAGPNNDDLSQDVIFAGAQYRSNATSGYGVEWRLYSVAGTPTVPGGDSPAYHGPQIQFYQRFKT
jgi:hypothetical protein